MPAKRQHYVPQFLLRHFAFEGNIYVFDKQKYEVRRQSTGNSAIEKYFYDYKDGNHPETLEDDLARLEDDSANILRKVIASNSLARVTGTERRVLAFFIATQMLRTPHKREYSRRHWDIFKHAVTSEEFLETWIGKLEEDWDTIEIDFAQHHMSDMKLMAPFFCVILEGYRWFLLQAPADERFFLSDHPTIVWNSSVSPDVGLGLLEKGVEVYLPIAPQLALLVAEPTCKIAAMGNIPLNVKDNSALKIDTKAMRLLNGLQVSFSERFVFASNDSFELAIEVLEYNPEWREGPKPELDEVLGFLRLVEGSN